MKKTLITLLAVLALGATAMAQGKGERFAIGLRVGEAGFASFDNDYHNGYAWGYNIEASGIFNISDRNRIEAELGWMDFGSDRYSTDGYLHLAGSFQWYWNIVAGLGWYVGPSANIGGWIWKYKAYGFSSSNGNFTLGVGAQVGLEYDFDFPLQLTLDARPYFNFMIPGSPYFLTNWFNLGVRYRF